MKKHKTLRSVSFRSEKRIKAMARNRAIVVSCIFIFGIILILFGYIESKRMPETDCILETPGDVIKFTEIINKNPVAAANKYCGESVTATGYVISTGTINNDLQGIVYYITLATYPDGKSNRFRTMNLSFGNADVKIEIEKLKKEKKELKIQASGIINDVYYSTRSAPCFINIDMQKWKEIESGKDKDRIAAPISRVAYNVADQRLKEGCYEL